MSAEPYCHVGFPDRELQVLSWAKQRKTVSSISTMVKHMAQMFATGCGSSNDHMASALSSNPCWPTGLHCPGQQDPVMLDI